MYRHLPRILTAVGAAFLVAMLAVLAVGGVMVLQTKAFLDRAMVTEGKVVEVDVRDVEDTLDGELFEKEYRPTIRFTPDGGSPVTTTVEDYEYVTYRVGDPVDVTYDPEDPTHAAPDFGPLNGWDNYIVAGGYGLLALALFPFALGLPLGGFFARRSQGWIRANGEPVTATITAVQPAPGAVDPHRPPWIIEVRLADPKTGEPRTVRSRPLAYDARAFFAAGQPITVRLDPRNAERHWVDTTPPAQAAATF